MTVGVSVVREIAVICCFPLSLQQNVRDAMSAGKREENEINLHKIIILPAGSSIERDESEGEGK